MKRKSAAFKFVEFLFTHALVATGHSWTRMNGALHQALMAAISGGLDFNRNDFERFVDCLRGGYWLGADPECYFTEAVRVMNVPAIHAFEKWQNRPPYILDGERMVRGRRFQYGKHFVECTSIRSDCFIAVEREGWKRNKFSDRIVRRFKINSEMLAGLRKDRREAAKSEARRHTAHTSAETQSHHHASSEGIAARTQPSAPELEQGNGSAEPGQIRNG